MTEILLALRKNDKPLTSLELSVQTKCSIASTRTALKRLKKDVSERLMFRILAPEEKEKIYGHRVGCKVKVFWLDE